MKKSLRGFNSVFTVGVLLFVVAPPLSIDNIICALKSLIEEWRRVGACLHIPDTAIYIMGCECSTPSQCLRAVIRYWLLKDPLASWKRLIYQLDGEKDFHGVTDRIRCNAEQLSGQQ